MSNCEMITYDLVRELFDYTSSGNLVRRSNISNVFAGEVAGYLHEKGYIYISIGDKNYLAHRLIWLWNKGYLPEGNLDHVNRIRCDNRIENLREVSSKCNSRNQGNSRANKSGVKGVCWDKSRGKWFAYIGAGYGTKKLGHFISFGEAVLYRLAAEQCLGWGNCDSMSPAYQYAVKNNLLRKGQSK